jgi:hypothetical protein
MAKLTSRKFENPEPSRQMAAEPQTAAPMIRRWLALLTILVTVPWLIVGGALLWQQQRQAVTGAAPGRASDATIGRAGPWGRLVTTPITVSPPRDYIPRDDAVARPLEWHFPTVTGGELERVLSAAGLPPQDAADLRSGMKAVPALNAVVVTPSADLISRMSPEARARVYLTLGRLRASSNNATINTAQATSYRFDGTSARDWLGPALKPETRNLVEPLIYRHGSFLYFADLDVVHPQIPDPDERQLLIKRLLRQRTLLVRVRMDGQTSVSEAAEYWGRGGRKTDLLPLLESVEADATDAFRMIDIVHLLPQIAREYLYRYPRPTFRDVGQSPLTNCLWTAFNFFNEEPEPLDKRYLDGGYGAARLKTDYFVVYDNYQLGDVAAFWDEKGHLVHVAVHLADDLVFSKNGVSELSPWTILRFEQLSGYFVEYADSWRVTYHRRKIG